MKKRLNLLTLVFASLFAITGCKGNTWNVPSSSSESSSQNLEEFNVYFPATEAVAGESLLFLIEGLAEGEEPYIQIRARGNVSYRLESTESAKRYRIVTSGISGGYLDITIKKGYESFNHTVQIYAPNVASINVTGKAYEGVSFPEGEARDYYGSLINAAHMDFYQYDTKGSTRPSLKCTLSLNHYSVGEYFLVDTLEDDTMVFDPMPGNDNLSIRVKAYQEQYEAPFVRVDLNNGSVIDIKDRNYHEPSIDHVDVNFNNNVTNRGYVVKGDSYAIRVMVYDENNIVIKNGRGVSLSYSCPENVEIVQDPDDEFLFTLTVKTDEYNYSQIEISFTANYYSSQKSGSMTALVLAREDDNVMADAMRSNFKGGPKGIYQGHECYLYHLRYLGAQTYGLYVLNDGEIEEVSIEKIGISYVANEGYYTFKITESGYESFDLYNDSYGSLLMYLTEVGSFVLRLNTREDIPMIPYADSSWYED